MTPVEALASGKPVIALGRGGALESVPLTDPVGGVLYDSPEESWLQAIEKFERMESGIVPERLREWAGRFCEKNFVEQMRGRCFRRREGDSRRSYCEAMARGGWGIRCRRVF